MRDFTMIPNSYLERMYSSRFSGSVLRLMLFISRKTLGFHKPSDWISYSQFENETGLDRSTIRRGLKELLMATVITKKTIDGKPHYSINHNTAEWKTKRSVGAKSTTSGGETASQVGAKSPPTKDIPTKESTKERTTSVPFGPKVSFLSDLLKEEILKNKPDTKLPASWDRDTRLAIQRLIEEGRTPDVIEKVIIYSQSDNRPRGSNGFCWAKVITAGSKLRKHFDTVEADMKTISKSQSEEHQEAVDYDMVLATMKARLKYGDISDKNEHERAGKCIAAFESGGMKAFIQKWNELLAWNSDKKRRNA